ncbi:hypothetical protein J5N97_013119 [Dioscorea zingiberensis]|uniref:rRNA-processing protein FYV7 n=1 Tax=Dioscorea zingiberensis TaxID=325984 RepID=A0A9D5CQ54_9LILI|nr:hypothetical protein J5N97_013119 [Dioscorea zingiberensis]
MVAMAMDTQPLLADLREMKSQREFHKNERGDTLEMGNKGNAHNYKMTNRKRNEKRMGGKGLSLEAFANAKSGPSGYNPWIIKKQREFYRNAKFVSKYKKSVQQQSHSGNHLPVAPKLEDDDDEGENGMNFPSKKKNKKDKKKNSLQSMREEFELRQAEEEKARMEREAIMQSKKEGRARAEAKRKTLRENMFKKTRFGQPVMKYRIKHLLEGIIENSSN